MFDFRMLCILELIVDRGLDCEVGGVCAYRVRVRCLCRFGDLGVCWQGTRGHLATVEAPIVDRSKVKLSQGLRLSFNPVPALCSSPTLV